MDSGGKDGRAAARRSATPAHFQALDSVRGIAALCVALYHINWYNPTLPLGLVRNSYLMVDLFFVLSGFVIFYAYGARIASRRGLADFVWLRFWRLYPLHVTFLIVFLLIELVKAGAVMVLPEQAPAFSVNNLSAFVQNLLLIQSFHITQAWPLAASDTLTYNFPSWSISLEFYVCILFGLMAVLLRRRFFLTLAAALLAAFGLITLALAGPGAMVTDAYGIARCVAGFFEGVVIFALYTVIRNANFVSAGSGVMMWLASAAFVGFFAFVAMDKAGYASLLVYPLAGTLVLSLALAPARGPLLLLHSRAILWLGTISYSVYMTHAAVIWLVGQIVHFGAGAREIHLAVREGLTLMPSAWVGVLATIVAVAMILALSNFTFHAIEDPFRRWSKRRIRRIGAAVG